MTCKLRTFGDLNEPSTIYEFSCNEVRKLKDEWFLEFRKKNASERVEKARGVDPYFEDYKKNIEDFLNQCNCHKG